MPSQDQLRLVKRYGAIGKKIVQPDKFVTIVLDKKRKKENYCPRIRCREEDIERMTEKYIKKGYTIVKVEK